MVRHAIERANPDDLAELARVSREVAQAGKSDDRIIYFRAKKALHDAQVHATHNDVLAGTMRILHAQARRFWWTYEPTESFPNASQLHCAITEHVILRDREKAVEAVGELFEHLEILTKQIIDRRQKF